MTDEKNLGEAGAVADVAAIARPPESLTKSERVWLRRRVCGWCEARADTNSCYATEDDDKPWMGKQCTADELNVRRGRCLANDYRPRPARQHLEQGATADE